MKVIFALIAIFIGVPYIYGMGLVMERELFVLNTVQDFNSVSSTMIDSSDFIFVSLRKSSDDVKAINPATITADEYFLYNANTNIAKPIKFEDGYKNGSVNILFSAISNNAKLFLMDIKTQRINVFYLQKDKLIFDYSINLDNIARAPVFLVDESKIYLSNPSGSELDSKMLAIGEIMLDVNYPQSKDIKIVERLVSCADYREDNSKKMFSFINNVDDSDRLGASLFESIETENIYNNIFVLEYKDMVLAVNSYGTEVFDITDNQEKRIGTIDTIKKLRKEDREIINRENFKPGKFDTYSQVEKVFIDNEEGVLLLYYRRSKKLKEVKGSKESFIIVKSLIDSDESEYKIPIDFIPVHFDADRKILSGFKNKSGSIYFVENKLEI